MNTPTVNFCQLSGTLGPKNPSTGDEDASSLKLKDLYLNIISNSVGNEFGAPKSKILSCLALYILLKK